MAEKLQMDKLLTLISVKLKSERLDVYETIAVAAMLSNLYHGVENILKQICQSKKLPIETVDRWHRHLLDAALTSHILSELTADQLLIFLQFRHFFVHGYSSDLLPERVIELGQLAQPTFTLFFEDIKEFLNE